jgi:hypothetical protein
MQDLRAAFQTLAAHIDAHGAASYYEADLGKLAADLGMTAVDRSDGFDTNVSYRAARDGKKLRLQYLMIPGEEGQAPEHNFCLALSGRGFKTQQREWRFAGNMPGEPDVRAG